MQTTVTLNLMKIVNDPEKFMNLINTSTLIDAKLSILTTEFETVQIDVVDFLSELNWTANCPETGELLEVE